MLKPKWLEIASTYTEFARTPITSAPISAIRTPRRTFPRTSPAMYAEYWKPMNWNSSTESISGKTVVEKMLLKKLLLEVAIRPDLTPVWAMCAEVTPPV